MMRLQKTKNQSCWAGLVQKRPESGPGEPTCQAHMTKLLVFN